MKSDGVVIIPTYNEKENIENMLLYLTSLQPNITDGASYFSQQVLLNYMLTYIMHNKNENISFAKFFL